MKPGAPQSAVDTVKRAVTEKGLETHLSQGKEVTIIGVVGNKNLLCNENIELMPFVDKIVPITESYKLTNKSFTRRLPAFRWVIRKSVPIHSRSWPVPALLKPRSS